VFGTGTLLMGKVDGCKHLNLLRKPGAQNVGNSTIMNAETGIVWSVTI